MRSSHPLFRAGLTLGAQSLASVTNFAATALALSAGDLGEFGRFAIAFQLCQIVVVIANGAVGDVVLIQTSRGRGDVSTTDLRDGAVTTGMLLGLGAGILFVGGAVAVPDMRTPLLLSAAGAPAIFAQYTLRARRYADDDPGGVMLADLVWLLVVVAGAVVDAAGWDATPNDYLAIWLLGAAVSGAPAILVGVTRGYRHVRTFWAATGSQLMKLAAEGLLARSVFVVSLIATEIVLDTTASGTLAVAVLVLSPMTVVHTAASSVVVPREVAHRGIHVVRRRVPLLAAGAVTAITLVWAAALWIGNSLDIGRGPFDLDANGVTGWLFTATVLRFVALAVWRGPLIGLRIADAAGDSLNVRLVGTTAQWTLPVLGLLTADLEGGAFGLALGTSIGAAEAWRRYLALDDTRGSVGGSSPPGDGTRE